MGCTLQIVSGQFSRESNVNPGLPMPLFISRFMNREIFCTRYERVIGIRYLEFYHSIPTQRIHLDPRACGCVWRAASDSATSHLWTSFAVSYSRTLTYSFKRRRDYIRTMDHPIDKHRFPCLCGFGCTNGRGNMPQSFPSRFDENGLPTLNRLTKAGYIASACTIPGYKMCGLAR